MTKIPEIFERLKLMKLRYEQVTKLKKHNNDLNTHFSELDITNFARADAENAQF